MARPSRAHAAVLAALVMTSVTICVADDLPACSGYVSLSVTPAQPDCDDVVTLGATQYLNDSCWTAEAPVFSDEQPDFAYQMASIDLYEPPASCVFVIIEIPFTRQVGPLPPGPYSLAVTHTSTSPRHGDHACSEWIPFEVACCAELPPQATSLLLHVTAAGTELWLNWNDVAGADDYVVFGSDAPDGPFTQQIQTASNGSAGTGVPIATAPSFFLVSARNECGVGPRH